MLTTRCILSVFYANKQHFVHGGKGTFQNYNADQNDYYLFLTDCYNRLDTADNTSCEAVKE